MSSEKTLPLIVNDGGTETTGATGAKTYTFDGSSGTGYTKSWCSTSGIPDCGSQSAQFEIKPNGSNSILVKAYKGSTTSSLYQYWSGYASSATITYQVSNPPSGSGSGGSVTVYPMRKYDQKAIVPASITPGSTPTAKTVTVLAKGSHAVQNFAFDIEE